MGNNVASIVFCGASFGIVDEDDDGDQPSLQRFDAIDGATKEESEDAFLTEFTNVLYGGLSVKKHDGDTSKKRLLKLDQDGETLIWSVKTSKTSSAKNQLDKLDAPFKLGSITSITRGAFPGKASTKKKAKRCFTIASDNGNTYRVETKDSETRDILADGFELMLRRTPNRA
eukprot:CAMPEP_0205917758 /NCGR_PEP_ID=MMETSP1325-20131115/9366_1 /ASSEMBLY_ACC=CAM_ASM_000708 /TAXON_ID=236786 /ORGANISM="Florenciella sp., Strain RCC1007" /LENGTH=171 /DNA_ID=CAMNT_0053285211 /DNA_START=51 /DNA_END=566 /DNA_ORIENTATION=-